MVSVEPVPLILSLGRQREVDFCYFETEPGLQSEFSDSQGYTKKPCLRGEKSFCLGQETKGMKCGTFTTKWRAVPVSCISKKFLENISFLVSTYFPK